MTGQNRSSAVMQQRAEPHDSLDDFPTPPWATRALCEWLVAGAGNDWDAGGLSDLIAREPAANRGHMARVLGEYFAAVEAADVHDYGAGYAVRDYLIGPLPAAVHWTITNPPVPPGRAVHPARPGHLTPRRRGDRALCVPGGCRALPRPVQCLAAQRHPAIHGARGDAQGAVVRQGQHGNGLLLDRLAQGFHWVAPCRRRLERDGDYPVTPSAPIEGVMQ